MNKTDINGFIKDTMENSEKMLIDVDAFNRLVKQSDDILIVDLRKDADYQKENFNNSISLPPDNSMKTQQNMMKVLNNMNKKIVIIDEIGFAACGMAKYFKSLNFTDVNFVYGGIRKYREKYKIK